MKIELCEDNGFLNMGGEPTLVILQITIDDKVWRVPYDANKTIKEVYAEVRCMKAVLPKDGSNSPEKVTLGQPKGKDFEPTRVNNEPEVEDIVKCVRLVKDLDGNTNEALAIGKEYRIIAIHKKENIIVGYDVMNDELNDHIRITCLAEEMQLERRHPPFPPKQSNFYEITEKCTVCNELNALRLYPEENVYRGICNQCGKPLTVQKVKVFANV